MKKIILYFIGLLFLISCSITGIKQDVTYTDEKYQINTWFKESGVSCSGSNRIVYDEYVYTTIDDLERVKKSEYAKAKKILYEMKEGKSTIKKRRD